MGWFSRRKQPSVNLDKAASTRSDRKDFRLNEVPKELLEKFGREIISSLELLYEECDADGSGYISEDEVIRLLQLSGLNPTAVLLDEVMKDVDADTDGKLSFVEFVQVWDRYLTKCSQEAHTLELAFCFFDYDGSSAINRDEFRRALTKFGDPLASQELEDFFRMVDVDNDGEVNLEEFLKMAYSQRAFLRKALDKHKKWEKQKEKERLEREEKERLDRERSEQEAASVRDGNALTSPGGQRKPRPTKESSILKQFQEKQREARTSETRLKKVPSNESKNSGSASSNRKPSLLVEDDGRQVVLNLRKTLEKFSMARFKSVTKSEPELGLDDAHDDGGDLPPVLFDPTVKQTDLMCCASPSLFGMCFGHHVPSAIPEEVVSHIASRIASTILTHDSRQHSNAGASSTNNYIIASAVNRLRARESSK